MEPAILILGTISDPDGAYGFIQIHLPNLVPYLMEVINNNNEIIRWTTLWTLSKFTKWIITQSEAMIDEYLTMICQRMTDTDSDVQEAACHAFTELVEQIEPEKLLSLQCTKENDRN